jgi:RNA polymerase sigma-70 factor (ECF subfamily)
MAMSRVISTILTNGLVVERAGACAKEAVFETHALVHKDAVHTACLSLTRHKDEADDLFQETYLRAFRSFHQFTPGTNCRAWLLTIMYNAFRNRYAQRVREQRTMELEEATPEYERKLVADGEAGRDDPAEQFLSRLVAREVMDALHRLPEEYRTVFLLVDMEDLSYDETATILACPIGTVRSRLARARRLLRTALVTPQRT